MSQNENDESIIVNIRTGTSTRPPLMRTIPQRQESFDSGDADITIEFEGNVPINSYEGLMILMHLANRTHAINDQQMLNQILHHSFNDGELKRDPNVQLDVESHNCHTDEIENTCIVCQNNFKLGEKLCTLEGCEHTFHFSCLKEWGKYKQECPLCRLTIPVLER